MSPRTATILDRALLLVATLVLVGYQYKIPMAWHSYLANHIVLIDLLIVAVAVFGALTPFQAFASRTRAEERIATQKRMLIALGEFCLIAQKVSPPLDIDDIGFHVWWRRRTLRHPFSGILRRIAIFRLGGSVVILTHFSPVRGKGVVGQCWERNQERSVDVEDLRQRLTTQARFDAYVGTMGSAAVMNLSWTEFEATKSRGAVFASPVRSRNRFIGCLSIDTSRGFSTLTSEGLLRKLNQIANATTRADFENMV